MLRAAGRCAHWDWVGYLVYPQSAAAADRGTGEEPRDLMLNDDTENIKIKKLKAVICTDISVL